MLALWQSTLLPKRCMLTHLKNSQQTTFGSSDTCCLACENTKVSQTRQVSKQWPRKNTWPPSSRDKRSVPDRGRDTAMLRHPPNLPQRHSTLNEHSPPSFPTGNAPQHQLTTAITKLPSGPSPCSRATRTRMDCELAVQTTPHRRIAK